MSERISVSINPSVQIAPYQFVKPGATVAFDATGDFEGDMAKAEAQLRRIVCRAVLVELNIINDLSSALKDGVEGLAAFCQKEIGYEHPGSASGTSNQSEETAAEVAAPPAKAGPRRVARKPA